MTYLVVIDGEFRVDRMDLVKSLERNWPGSRVTLADPGTPGADDRDVEWEYDSDWGRLEGYAHVDGRGVYLEGPLDIVADFVVWYRGMVPDGENVIFCDDEYSFDGIVPPGADRDFVKVIGD